MVGLLYHKENRIETIKEALIRYIEHNNLKQETALIKPLEKARSILGASRDGKLVTQAAEPSLFGEYVDVFDINFKKDLRIFH